MSLDTFEQRASWVFAGLTVAASALVTAIEGGMHPGVPLNRWWEVVAEVPIAPGAWAAWRLGMLVDCGTVAQFALVLTFGIGADLVLVYAVARSALHLYRKHLALKRQRL